MSLLKNTLRNSVLLRPWVELADFSSPQIAQCLGNSFLNRFFRFSANETSPRLGGVFFQVWYALLIIGVLGLLGLLTFSSTGIIGAATVLLLGWVLLGGIVFRAAFFNRLTSVDLLVLCFLGSAVVSTAFSSYTHYAIIGLAKMLTFIAGYTVFRVLTQKSSFLIAALMIVLALLGLGESLIGFYQHIHHIQPLATWSDPSINPELQMDRIFGTLQPSNPNLLAGFLIPCFAAAAGISLLFLRKKTWLFTVISALSAMAILVALVWTGSRGGFLAIAIMLLTFFTFLGHLIWHENTLKPFKWLKPLWVIVLLLGLLGGAGGILSSQKIRTRVLSIFAMREDSSISYRFNVYNSAFHMVKDNPVVGIGPGNGVFKQVYGLYMVPGYNALGSYSVPLEITVEQGFIGLFIFLSLLLILKIRTLEAVDNPTLSLQRKVLASTLLSGILGLFMYGIFDTIWYRPSVNLLFWLMVAGLAYLTEPKAEKEIQVQQVLTSQ